MNILESINNLINSLYRQRVEVLIFNKENQILLTTIPPYGELKEPYHGFPGGGIEPNEDIIESIKRETLEEVGLDISNIKKINIKPFIMEWSDQIRKLKKTNHKGSITNYYKADLVKENKKLYNKEDDAVEYQFVDIQTAKDLIINDIRSHINSEGKLILQYRLKVICKFI
jgi:8-oxo-dGTP pyrophosphatase MutT (NUDIX family)